MRKKGFISDKRVFYSGCYNVEDEDRRLCQNTSATDDNAEIFYKIDIFVHFVTFSAVSEEGGMITSSNHLNFFNDLGM